MQYYQEARPATHRFHSNYSPSYFWGFNGKYPSETPLNFYGHPTIVRFKNKLPLVHNNGGRNEITIHLHNGHTASESDGFAGDWFTPGFFKDNHYANAYAGIDAFGGIGDQREAMHTFWFHDHRARWTAPNNYLGLNGMYIVYDNFDTPLDFLAPSSSASASELLWHNRHPADTHRQDILRHRPNWSHRDVPGAGRPGNWKRSGRRQMGGQRQNSAEIRGQKAQIPLPHTEYRAGQGVEPDAG